MASRSPSSLSRHLNGGGQHDYAHTNGHGHDHGHDADDLGSVDPTCPLQGALGLDIRIETPSHAAVALYADVDGESINDHDDPDYRESRSRKGSCSLTYRGSDVAAAAATTATSVLVAEGGGVGEPTEEDYIRVQSLTGYTFCWSKELRYFLVALLTGGFSCLLAYWFPRRSTPLRYRRETDLRRAEYAVVEAVDGGFEFVPVERVGPHPSAYEPRLMGKVWLGPRHLDDPERHPATYVAPAERMVLFRHHRFVLDPEARPPAFVKQREPLQECAVTLAERLERGLDPELHQIRQKSFGLNQLTIVVPSYPALLMRELFHPFFIFQIYSVVLWCFEEYFIFALCIFVIATVSIVTTLLETRGRLSNLAALARFDVELTVLRNSGPGTPARMVRISSSQLVAGDVVEVECGMVPCDLALLQGGAVVNEAMLTGEAIPVIKTPLHMPLDPRGRGRDVLVPLGIEARSTLYAATKILQLKPAVPGAKVWGLVVRTGFATTKGGLILSILYPRPSSFGFITQSYKFIGALFCMALVGFAIAVWQLAVHGASTQTMIIRGLDLITIVVPPSLPLALSVGTNFAMGALKLQKIFCISPSRINLAGKIQWMCFDKTGTLTSEGMELMGVLPALAGVFSAFHATPSATDEPSESPDTVAALAREAISPPCSASELESDGEGHHGGGPHVAAALFGRDRGWSSLPRGDHESAVHLNGMVNRGGESPTPPLSSAARLSGLIEGVGGVDGGVVQPLSADLLTAMSCCHSIAALNGELIGDPLEIEIFNSTRARLHDASRDGFVCFVTCPLPARGGGGGGSLGSAVSATSSDSESEGGSGGLFGCDSTASMLAEWGVLTQFEFVPALQRMSVIVARQDLVHRSNGNGHANGHANGNGFSHDHDDDDDSDGEDVRVLVKGSPEAMRPLCLAESIPSNFDRTLSHYAARGYRIIAVGHKRVANGRAGLPRLEKEPLRAWCEQGLTFLGLLVLENKVKPETAPTLAALRHAAIRSVVVSGDNPLTSTSVAKECGIVEPGTRVFLSHVRTDPLSGRQHVEFIDTDERPESGVADAEGHLHPMRLNPRTLAYDGPRRLGMQQFKYELALTGAAFKLLEERHQASAASRGEKSVCFENQYVDNYSSASSSSSSHEIVTASTALAASTPPSPSGDSHYDLESGFGLGLGSDAHSSHAQMQMEESDTRFFHRVLLSTLVFARMTPDDKGSLVAHLQSLGIYTGMCGDGANDAPALKTGHIGVSLSDSEASIAAPFTYQRPNISCIPVLLSEGRSSLMTSFQLFKYMAMYSTIQFSAIILLYFKGTVFGNWEYLLQDMFIVFPLTVLMGSTRSDAHLSRKRPSGNLLSIVNVCCVLGHMVLCFCFQMLVFNLSRQQVDYVDYSLGAGRDGTGVCVANGPCTYEATSVYYYSNFQYIWMALLFARGAPWKASVWSNRRFSVWALLCIVVSLALLFSQRQGSFFREEEVPIGLAWRGYMFMLVLLDGAVASAFSLLVYPAIVARYKRWTGARWKKAMVYGKLKNVEGPKSKLYHRLRGEFEANWNRVGA